MIERLLFPVGYQRWVDVVSRRDFVDSSLTFDCFKNDFRLEFSGVPGSLR